MSKLMISLIVLMFPFMKSNNDFEPAESAELLPRVDHLVYATPDLNRGIDEIEKLTGVRASPGGRHPGRGTRNALLSLGPAIYLEIIGPDPEQSPPKTPPPFGIDNLKESRLVTWVAKGNDLEKLRQEAARNGIELGEVISGSRQRPDGILLSWRYTNPQTVVANGIVPFFIDWGQSVHPSRTAAGGLSLIGLSAEHPDAERVQKMLSHLGLELPVRQGSKPALIAVITGPKGRVELR